MNLPFGNPEPGMANRNLLIPAINLTPLIGPFIDASMKGGMLRPGTFFPLDYP
jgi:hypothetical protein